MAQQAPQKKLLEDGAVDIAELYEEVIEATIAQCKLLQNAKVLAAIEKEWRQSLRRKQAELRRAASARQDAAAAATSRSTVLGPEQTPPCATEGLPANAGGAGVAPPTTGSTQLASDAPADPLASTAEAEDAKEEKADEDTDDEFADAEIDEAEEAPPVLGARPSLEGGERQQQNSAAANAANGRTEAPRKPLHSNEGNASEQQADSDEDNEEGAGMTLDDVSDLDDREPPTTDGIFGFYEKVERAAAGAAKRTSKWKVMLRHGILRVGGREIPFDRITGEFSF